MTEAQDLFARLGFDKSAPPPPQPVGLDGYLIDLFVARLPGAEIAKRRREGFYRGLSEGHLDGYRDLRGKG